MYMYIQNRTLKSLYVCIYIHMYLNILLAFELTKKVAEMKLVKF